MPITLWPEATGATGSFLKNCYLAGMLPSPGIPYRSLFKTAVVTAPLLGLGFAMPIFIAAGLDPTYLWLVIPMATLVCFMAWLANIGFLRWRERLGRWKWLQIFILGGIFIGISLVLLSLFGSLVPPDAQRLAVIRYLNAFAVNAIIYVIIDFRLLSDTKARLVEENAQLRLNHLETQYQILKDQVNPHFLFNALGTAKSLARRDPALTEAYIIRLSDFLRATLQETPDEVLLQDELRLVRDYVELQKMRFQDALVFVPIAGADSPDWVGARYKLPYFSLLTLVENAVKHNAMTPESPLHIVITLAGRRITVRNNRQAKALYAPSNGSGLSNLQRRCRILGHGDLEVVETPEAFVVSFDLLEG